MRTFVRALILNTAVYREAVRKQRIATVIAQNRVPLQTQPSIQPVKPSVTPAPMQRTMTAISTLYAPRTQHLQPLLPRPLPPQRTSPPQPLQTITFTNQLIQQLLNDPGIQSIECPGPGKPLVTVKQNRPFVTSHNLTSESIETFLQEVAQKTKIPLTPGLYKAILGQYIITAVLSDIIGNRFIIQRR